MLVVGAGGLGCEILKNLALSGFTDIHVIDLDTVDVSNLNRQVSAEPRNSSFESFKCSAMQCLSAANGGSLQTRCCDCCCARLSDSWQLLTHCSAVFVSLLQFLFRKHDIDKPKSEVAAKFIRQRCPGVDVKAHTKPIQEFGAKWYAQFDLVIAGLDNVEARQWLNATLVSLVKFDDEGNVDPDTVIPLIDGGTEGFQGQARVFLPRITSCFECSLASMPPQTGFAVCTIRNVPRIPEVSSSSLAGSARIRQMTIISHETRACVSVCHSPQHCIIYALKIEWPLLTSFTSVDDYVLSDRATADAAAASAAAAGAAAAGGDDDMEGTASVRLDKDNVQHMSWLYNRALSRASKFGIHGVTYNLTMQVVKGIIPAIASTNALISAACVSEALKYRTGCGPILNNYFMYIGANAQGVNSETIAYQRNPACAVCQPPLILRALERAFTLGDLLSKLTKEQSLQSPSLSLNGSFLYLSNLHEDHKMNLEKSLGELIQNGNIIVANDKAGKSLKVLCYFAQ